MSRAGSALGHDGWGPAVHSCPAAFIDSKEKHS